MPKENAPSNAPKTQAADYARMKAAETALEDKNREIAEIESKLAALAANPSSKSAEILARIAERENELGIPHKEAVKKGESKNKKILGRLAKTAKSSNAKKSQEARPAVVAAAPEREAAVPEAKALPEDWYLPKPVPEKAAPIPAFATVDAVNDPKPAPRQPDAPEYKEEDFKKLSETYAKKGLGEIATQLSGNTQFQSLPEGQKLLVMQGLSDRLYQHVREEGVKTFREEHAKSGFFKKIGRSIVKNAITAKHEKDALKALTGADAERFVQEAAPELIKVFSQSGLNSYVSDDGKTVRTMYAQMDKHGLVDDTYRFNTAANNLARIPDDWGKPGATRSEKRAYKNAEQEFKKQQGAYLSELESKARAEGIPDPKAYAAQVASETETMVRTMALLTSDPKALDRLGSISKYPAWLRGVKDIVVERTALTGAGAATNYGRLGRAGVAALFGAGSAMSAAAAPITALVVGGFRGYARGKEGIRERDRLARTGVQQDGSTAKRMSDVGRKIGQLEAAKNLLQNSTSAVEREQALIKLKTYSDFIEAKLQLGQVNFGEESGRFARQYELMRSLHEAKVSLAIDKLEPEFENAFAEIAHGDVIDADPLRARVRSFGGLVHANTESARKREVLNSTLKGAGYGALFGSAGAAARYFGEHMGWIHHAETAQQAGHSSHSVAAPHAAEFHGSGHLHETVDRNLIHPQHPELTKLHPGHHADVASETPAASHTVASVAFSSKGAEQTILNLRHSPGFKNLNPEQQAAFEGNVTKIAKQLEAFRPNAADGKESLSFMKGTEFNVGSDGRIFAVDPSGHETLLGHIEGSTIKADAKEADLTYIHAGHSAPSGAAHHAAETAGKAHRATPESLGIRKPTPEEQAYARSLGSATYENTDNPQVAAAEAILKTKADSAAGLESLRGSATPASNAPSGLESLRGSATPATAPSDSLDLESIRGSATPVENNDFDPSLNSAAFENTNNPQVEAALARLNVTDKVREAFRDYVPGQEFTKSQLERLEHLTDNNVMREVDHYFSFNQRYFPFTKVEGTDSRAWLSWSHRPASAVMATPVLPSFRPFIQHVRELAERYPNIRRDQELKEFLKQAYLAMFEDAARSGKLKP